MTLAVIQSSFLLLLALCTAYLLRSRQAAVRHFILTVGIACSLGAPVVARLMPKLEFASVPALPSVTSNEIVNLTISASRPVPTEAANLRVRASAPPRL